MILKDLYIMLTRNETLFCKLITLYTGQTYAHSSLLFAEDFTQGYSFSRKYINNPFIGGFMLETYEPWLKKFPHSKCCVYKLQVTQEQYDEVYKMVHSFYEEREKYTYNILGVVGRVFNLEISPENSYFCSQFLAYVLQESGVLDLGKKPICVTPSDFVGHPDLTLIYEGSLSRLIKDPSLATNPYLNVTRELAF